MRVAFAKQAEFCERLSSPLTARLCAAIGVKLDRSFPLGARILDWPGDPDPQKDGLPLRLCGGLHALVRSGDAPELAAAYPPAPTPDLERLWNLLEPVLKDQGDTLGRWLDNAPQTNEVGRSSVLMSGLLVVADRFRLPIRLFELGASAGLNLVLDRYGYDLGGTRAGDPASMLQLRPEWQGAAPPAAEVRIVGRAGVDLNPGDVVADRERLPAYIWPDQPLRLRQQELAIALAAADPPRIERADAADWIDAKIAPQPEPGVARVVMHSVAFQYFPHAGKARITGRMERAGARATEDAPLAWLRYEFVDGDEAHSLRLRTWPGKDRLLAFAHPHGASIRWLA